MLLDIQRNEMVFSGMYNPKEIMNALQAIKGVKYRVSGGHIYLSLAYFEAARRVLVDYKKDLRFTARYETFAHFFVLNKSEVVIDWYPDICKIQGGPIPFDKIIPLTSYFTKDAVRSKDYEKQRWDGTVQLFDVLKQEFPSGLLERVTGALRESGTPFTINQHFEYPKPVFDLSPKFNFKPTDDQLETVEALYKANNGIAKLPTGFGKTSYVAAALIARKGVRSMFLANQRVLINDAKRDFEEVFEGNDIHIGTIGDGEYDPGDITVASIQGVVAALKKPTDLEFSQAGSALQLAEFRLESAPDDAELQKVYKKASKKVERLKERKTRHYQLLEFLKTVDLFIVDESQVLGTDMWNKFLRACPAPYRYTLSATDTRTDGGRIQIVAATGERRFASSASEQIEKGRLAEFQAFFHRFDHGLDKKLMRDLQLDYHQAYRLFIMENEARNSYLCDWLIKWAHEGFSVLGLVTRTEHAEIVQEMLLAKGMHEKMFRYVDGSTPKRKRQQDIEDFRNGVFPILLGTSIFDVGFNAKNASKIVRFNAGASEVRETQRAGRTVRKRDDDSRGESIDILDLNVPFFESQGFKRMKLLKEEFGKERVTLLPGTTKSEFDVSRLDEVVANIPDATDRARGEEVLKGLGVVRDVQKVEEEFDTKDIEKDKDLMDILADLRFEMEDI